MCEKDVLCVHPDNRVLNVLSPPSRIAHSPSTDLDSLPKGAMHLVPCRILLVISHGRLVYEESRVLTGIHQVIGG